MGVWGFRLFRSWVLGFGVSGFRVAVLQVARFRVYSEVEIEKTSMGFGVSGGFFAGVSFHHCPFDGLGLIPNTPSRFQDSAGINVHSFVFVWCVVLSFIPRARPSSRIRQCQCLFREFRHRFCGPKPYNRSSGLGLQGLGA